MWAATLLPETSVQLSGSYVEEMGRVAIDGEGVLLMAYKRTACVSFGVDKLKAIYKCTTSIYTGAMPKHYQ